MRCSLERSERLRRVLSERACSTSLPPPQPAAALLAPGVGWDGAYANDLANILKESLSCLALCSSDERVRVHRTAKGRALMAAQAL